jgi:hypothetical protein
MNDNNTYISSTKTGKEIITISYEMEYNNYKKKLIKEIFSQLDEIFKIFDEELNENIVKVYILILKNKIPDIILNEILIFYEFLSDLKDLEYIDQYDYLNIIFDLIKLKKSLEKINNFFINKTEIGIFNLINWKFIKNKFEKILKVISEKNIILKILYKIDEYSVDLIKVHHEEIKILIRKLADTISFDFFMYYSSSKIFKQLYTKLFVDIKNINNISNNCIILIIKYKKYFIDQYKIKYELFCEMYYDVKISNITKYKYIKKNKYFEELFLYIKSVDNSYKL